jgi:hypothetical protein
MKVKGTIIPGYGVASGKGHDTRCPEGTLRLQYPFVKERGLDLGNYFLGTLNINISPFRHFGVKLKTQAIFLKLLLGQSIFHPKTFTFLMLP